MQLTRFSDLSLRVLLYLAGRGDGEGAPQATARATAEMFNVPYTHLVKVVHTLGLLGFVTTTKGKGGGLRLSRPAKKIRVGEVVRRTEPNAPIINCFEPACPLRCDCLLKKALDRAQESFYRELDQHTLAELAETPSLKKLVRIANYKREETA